MLPCRRLSAAARPERIEFEFYSWREKNGGVIWDATFILLIIDICATYKIVISLLMGKNF